MSDTYPANIQIGGVVPGNLLEGLIDAIAEDCPLGDSRPCSSREGNRHRQEVAFVSKNLEDGVLQFTNEDAENGEFSHTEDFCVKHGIAFDRQCGYWHEFNAEDVTFRPSDDDSAVPLVILRDFQGSEIVCGDTVRKATDAILYFQSNYDTSDRVSDWEKLAKGITLLREACPVFAEDLPKFQVEIVLDISL